jgi:polyphenol oxidase
LSGTRPAPGSQPRLPDGVARVREAPSGDGPPLFVHPDWARELPWLVQGTTGRGTDGAWDFGLFGRTPVDEAMRRWRALQASLGVNRVVHSRQVHRDSILEHETGPPGLGISDGFDGHATSREDLLLTVSIADCVPIFLVDPERRRVALLHGGWRGTARGILARGLERLGAEPATVRLHLGPAICGTCYEVGPEVHEALGLTRPAAPTPVDVRVVLANQAVAAGVRPGNVSVSDHCTRCGDGFYSHRGGSPGRQLGVLGLRA